MVPSPRSQSREFPPDQRLGTRAKWPDDSDSCLRGIWRNGGESGIRTHVRVSPKHAFQACAFSHSAISPVWIWVPGGWKLSVREGCALGAALCAIESG